MSLTITHGCWNGSATDFGEWRNVVAETVGYALEEHYEVYGGKVYGFMQPRVNRSRLTDDNAYGDWKKTPSDPLVVLFYHHDYTGFIHPEQAIPLANRLESIIDRLPEQYVAEPTGDFWFDLNPNKGLDYKELTRKFVDGLRLAASKGESVEFLG